MIERATVAVLCPVGSSRRGGFRGEDSAGSGTVLDDELLFQPASQLVRQNAHPDVCDATGPIGNDELHRAIRIIGLGAGGHNHHGCREKRTGDERLAQQADWPYPGSLNIATINCDRAPARRFPNERNAVRLPLLRCLTSNPSSA
jgi:hypothetical protein